MKNLLCSLPAKIAAIMLSYVMVLVIVLSSAAALGMGYLDFYTRSSYLVEKDILTEMAVSECNKLIGQFQSAADIQAFREEVGNMAWEVNYAYTVIDKTGEILYTNYNINPRFFQEHFVLSTLTQNISPTTFQQTLQPLHVILSIETKSNPTNKTTITSRRYL